MTQSDCVTVCLLAVTASPWCRPHSFVGPESVTGAPWPLSFELKVSGETL